MAIELASDLQHDSPAEVAELRAEVADLRHQVEMWERWARSTARVSLGGMGSCAQLRFARELVEEFSASAGDASPPPG